MESRVPRDGRVLEQLGTYDPMIPETDARVALNVERISYWLSVGALPSDKVKVLLKKYGEKGTHLEKQKEAQDRLVQARRRPTPAPVPVTSQKEAQPAEPAEAAAAEPAAE